MTVPKRGPTNVDKVDVLPGQKTNILAAVFALGQAALAFGVVSPEQVEVANQVLAALVPVFLGLKARRAAVGSPG